MFDYDTYDECVQWAKDFIGSIEYWIFEDAKGKLRLIQPTDKTLTPDEYKAICKDWTLKGRVYTETKVYTVGEQ